MDESCMGISVYFIHDWIILLHTLNSESSPPSPAEGGREWKIKCACFKMNLERLSALFPVKENQQGAMFSHQTVPHMQHEGCTWVKDRRAENRCRNANIHILHIFFYTFLSCCNFDWTITCCSHVVVDDLYHWIFDAQPTLALYIHHWLWPGSKMHSRSGNP